METKTKPTTMLIGVSSNFGRAVAYFCLKAGHNVLISARSEEKLTAIKRDLKKFGKIDFIRADVSTSEGCEVLFHDAEEKAGKIDNIGLLVGGFFNDNPEGPTALDPMLRNNVIIPTNVISSASKYLTSGSSIVLVSSTQTMKMSHPVSYSYTISKSALNRVVETSASFLMRKGIRINAVAPSQIMDSFETGRNWKELRKMGDSITPPEDIALVIVWLFSETSQWVTGTIIPVDGGERFLKR